MKNVFTSIFSRPLLRVIFIVGLVVSIGFVYLGFITSVIPEKNVTLTPAVQL